MSTDTTVTSLDGFPRNARSAPQGRAGARLLRRRQRGERKRASTSWSTADLSPTNLRGHAQPDGPEALPRRPSASFSDLRFDVHENVGVLVEATSWRRARSSRESTRATTAGVAATGNAVQTSAPHIFRVSEDRLVEHWPVVDTYRILVAIGAIPGVATVFQEQILGVPASPGGLFEERLGPSSAEGPTTADTRGVPGRGAASTTA